MLVDRESGDDLLLGSEALRQAFMDRVPALLVGSALASKQSTFVSQIELVAGGRLSGDELASRYTRHPAMRKIVEIATAGFVERGEIGARIRLTGLGGYAAAALDGSVARKRRWRGIGTRQEAVETLLCRGERRCLLPGCGIALIHADRLYCSQHSGHERWRGHPDLKHKGRARNSREAREHDRRLEAVGQLLDEVASLIRHR